MLKSISTRHCAPLAHAQLAHTAMAKAAGFCVDQMRRSPDRASVYLEYR